MVIPVPCPPRRFVPGLCGDLFIAIGLAKIKSCFVFEDRNAGEGPSVCPSRLATGFLLGFLDLFGCARGLALFLPEKNTWPLKPWKHWNLLPLELVARLRGSGV